MTALRPSLGSAFVLIAASLATADPPAAKDKEKEPEKPPPVRIVQKGQAVGTVNNWNETEGKFTLHMKVQYLEPNAQAQQNYARDMQNIMVRQQNLMTIRNPVQRQQEMVKIMQDAQRLQGQGNLFTVKERDQNIDVELAEDGVVRLGSPPVVFDEKGNAKKLTAEELKEMKGPDNLPGYTADRDALRNGQMVMVVIGHKTGGPKKPDDKKDVDKKPEDDKKPDPADKKKPPAPMPTKIIMVVILAEPKN
jgi:hypothetical protein